MLAFMVYTSTSVWCTPRDNGRSWRYRYQLADRFVLNFAHLIVNVLLAQGDDALLESV